MRKDKSCLFKRYRRLITSQNVSPQHCIPRRKNFRFTCKRFRIENGQFLHNKGKVSVDEKWTNLMKQNWTNLMKQITADLCHLPKDFLSPLCFHVLLLPMDKSETNRKNNALALAQFS